MADIELVIKIPEGLKKDFETEQWAALSCMEMALFCMEMKDALMNGTPLPKGHDRLVDMKNLQNFVSQHTEHDAVQLILADREDYIPTIIEADKECEDKE